MLQRYRFRCCPKICLTIIICIIPYTYIERKKTMKKYGSKANYPVHSLIFSYCAPILALLLNEFFIHTEPQTLSGEICMHEIWKLARSNGFYVNRLAVEIESRVEFWSWVARQHARTEREIMHSIFIDLTC